MVVIELQISQSNNHGGFQWMGKLRQCIEADGGESLQRAERGGLHERGNAECVLVRPRSLPSAS